MSEAEKLERRVKRLPESMQAEVLDFVEFLEEKQQRNDRRNKVVDAGNDPVKEIIGLADVEPFSGKIDEDIYEKQT